MHETLYKQKKEPLAQPPDPQSLDQGLARHQVGQYMQNPEIIQAFPPFFVDILFHGGDFHAVPQEVGSGVPGLHNIGGDSVDGVAGTDPAALAAIPKATFVFHAVNSVILRLILIVVILSRMGAYVKSRLRIGKTCCIWKEIHQNIRIQDMFFGFMTSRFCFAGDSCYNNGNTSEQGRNDYA